MMPPVFGTMCISNIGGVFIIEQQQKFMRLKDMSLLDMLIAEMVHIALDKGIIRSKSIIVDATHTEELYSYLKVQEKLNLLEESFNDDMKHLETSKDSNAPILRVAIKKVRSQSNIRKLFSVTAISKSRGKHSSV